MAPEGTMNNRTVGFLLILAGAAWALWRLRSGSGVNPSPGGGLGAGTGGGGGGLTIGQVGSNFIESNSLADAVAGLVQGIWGDGGGEGYGGSLELKTPDGTLRYKAPVIGNPLITNSKTGKLYFNP